MDELNTEEKALIVAMEMLRYQVARLTTAMIANATDSPATMKKRADALKSKSKDDEDDVEKSSIRKFGESLAKFAAITGPLIALAAIVTNVMSGFQLLATAIKILATAFAPILLPVLVILSAAMIAAADVIFKALLPAMGDWYKFVIANLIPAALELADAFLQAADWILRNTVGAVEEVDRAGKENIDWFDRQVAGVAEFLGLAPEGTTDTMSQMQAERAKREDKPRRYQETREGINQMREHLKGLMSPDAGGMGKFKQAFGSALDDVVKSLQMQIGPKAQMSGTADVWKNATMAALNADPLEMRQLQMQQKIFDLLKQSINEWKEGDKPKSAPAFATAPAFGSAEYTAKFAGKSTHGMSGSTWGAGGG